MSHPDEVVKVEHEVPSKLMAEAAYRHEAAGGDTATPQEKKQAAVEQAHALSTRPDGSYAQLHETEEATLAVADKAEVKALKDEEKRQADADAKLQAAWAKAVGKEGGPAGSTPPAKAAAK